MKYTRYDLKRENSNKTFIFMICLILIAAFLLGTVIFKLLIGASISSNSKIDSGNSIFNNNKNSSKSVNNSSNENKVVKFIAVQGGIYQNKQNADTEMSLLSQYGTPFTVPEDSKNRVLLGIYTEDQGEKIIKSLTDQKVDNSKILFTINNNDLCDEEISELINANIQILNKLSEKNVKAIQTDELKKWCAALQKVDKSSKNLAVLNDMTDYVNKLPKEVSKDKVGENYTYIYGILKKISSK